MFEKLLTIDEEILTVNEEPKDYYSEEIEEPSEEESDFKERPLTKPITEPVFRGELAYVVNFDQPRLTFFSRPEISEQGTEIKSLLDFLENRGCEVKDKEQTEKFFLKYPQTINALRQAPNKIFEYFGKSKIKLEIVTEPEETGDEMELFLKIRTKLDIKEARERMNKIKKEWLFPLTDKGILSLVLRLEFM